MPETGCSKADFGENSINQPLVEMIINGEERGGGRGGRAPPRVESQK